MAQAIPIGEATELGQIDPATLRPKMGSLPATGPAPAEGGLLRSSAFSKAVRATKVLGKVGGLAAVGAAGANTASDVAGTDTQDYYKRFGMEDNGSDGLGRTAKDVGVRLLGAASDLGNTLTGGFAGKFYRDKQETAAAATPAVDPAAPGGIRPQTNDEGAYPASITDPGNNPVQIRPGVFSNVADNSKLGGVSTIPDSGLRATNGEVLSAARANDTFGPGAHNPDGTGGYASLGSGVSDHNKNFASDVAAGKVDQAIRLGGVHGPQQAAAITNQFNTNQGNVSAERIASLRDQGETTRAIASNKTQAAIHDAANKVTSRGQDMELEGKTIPLRMAQAMRDRAAQYAQGAGGGGAIRTGGGGSPSAQDYMGMAARADANGDTQIGDHFRQQAASVQSQDSAAQTQRDTAYTALHTKIAGMLPPTTDANGKQVPDMGKAAEYAAGLNAKMADKQKQLEDAVAKNPNDLQSRALLTHMQNKGAGALEEDDVAKHVAGMQARDLRDKYGSAPYNPVGGTPITSTAPVSSLRLKKQLTGDVYETMGANGKPDGGSIPARAVDRDGSFIGGIRNNTFDRLKSRAPEDKNGIN